MYKMTLEKTETFSVLRVEKTAVLAFLIDDGEKLKTT